MIILDIILMILLSYFNYKAAKRKGCNGATYAFITVALVLGGEFLGAIIGMALSGDDIFSINGLMIIAPIGFAGAVLGGVVSFFIAKSLKPRESNEDIKGDGLWNGYNARRNGENWLYYEQDQVFPRVYERSQEAGTCDVCGGDIEPGQGYIIPIDTFYSSQKYKDWLVQNPVTRPGVQSLGGPDKYLGYMRAKAESSHTVVCDKCIGLFN